MVTYEIKLECGDKIRTEVLNTRYYIPEVGATVNYKGNVWTIVSVTSK